MSGGPAQQWARSIGKYAAEIGTLASSDPQGLLQGNGKQVRRIGLKDAAVLETTAVRALVAQAVKRSRKAWPRNRRRRMVIRAVSDKQRPRRPAV